MISRFNEKPKSGTILEDIEMESVAAVESVEEKNRLEEFHEPLIARRDHAQVELSNLSSNPCLEYVFFRDLDSHVAPVIDSVPIFFRLLLKFCQFMFPIPSSHLSWQVNIRSCGKCCLARHYFCLVIFFIILLGNQSISG